MQFMKFLCSVALLVEAASAFAAPALVDIEALDDPKFVPELLTPPPTPRDVVVDEDEE
jgi:hypothetical protein